MITIANIRNINWRKLVFRSIKFSWAIGVLIVRLLVIFSVRLICLMLNTRTHQQPKAPKDKYIPALKPCAMYLDKNDSQFLMKRDRLKKDGYLWHSGLRVWVQPTVKIDRSHPDFHDKTTELKKLGYIWNRATGQWELTFPKYQVIRVYQHTVVTED